MNAQHRNQNFCGISSKLNLIFLGKQFSGKSALIARLRNELLVGEKSSAAAFEYNYIDLKYAGGESRLVVSFCAVFLGQAMQKGQVRACACIVKLVQINQNAYKIHLACSMWKQGLHRSKFGFLTRDNS